ncbi:hypothetical protein ABPG77_008058 [Micractinium sp. CCAP 211/92]
MSRNYFASQYDSGYRPKALDNWEEPDKSKVVRPGAVAAPLKTEDGRTIPIVNEKGHIVRGGKKPAAFTAAPPGIATDYLPASTVPLRTVEVQGCKERTFH